MVSAETWACGPKPTISAIGPPRVIASSGVVQIATFPIPYPRKPLMTPDVFHLAFGVD